MKKDKHVDITLNLDYDILVALMLLAHEKDVTLNELVNQILKEHIARQEEEDAS